MKLQRYCLAIALGILCLHQSKAQTIFFNVWDPQANWNAHRGVFQQASITLRPVGIYTEVGLYLTIAAPEGTFETGTQLEAGLNFSLPQNAIVNDSWLWVDSTIIQAKIMDRWSATTIYENIVNRRKDPSLLTKNGNVYSLRVYPLIMGKSRRVKINYLMPGEWTAEEVKTVLPADILRSSWGSNPEIEIKAFVEAPWKNPRLPSHPELVFTSGFDPVLGNYFATRIPKASLDNRELSFTLDSPLNNGVFLTRSGNDQEGTYQMVLLPEHFLKATQIEKPQRVMVLVQYEAERSPGVTAKQLLSTIKSQLKKALGPEDFFNVALAGVVPQVLAKDWVSADEKEIDRIFDGIAAEKLSGFNLPGLLAKGIEVIKTGGAEGKVVVFANSGSEGGANTANALVKELEDIKGNTNIPFFIADFATHNTPSYYVNYNSFGNAFFYLRWTYQTKGDFRQQKFCCGSFEELANDVMTLALAEKGPLDLHTSLDAGFCYNRYDLNHEEGLYYQSKPILQIGRYQGKWPFVIELAGISHEYETVNIPFDLAEETDSTGTIIWSGQYIKSLEDKLTIYSPSYGDIQKIQALVEQSIQMRVLSNFTAFLCLEPSQGGEPCFKCLSLNQGGLIISTRDLQDSLVLSKISPNPFRERVMIELKFKELIDLSNARIAVYNHLGQVVRTFSDVPKGKVQDLELHWDGTSDGVGEVPPGVYIFRLQTPGGQYSRKLVKLDR